MTQPTPELSRELFLFRLNRLAALSGQPLIRYCEGQYGISRREWRLIVILSQQGPSHSSDLADRARLPPGPTSKAVSLLAEKGLITRTPVPMDRRRVVIALTPRGHEIFNALYPVVQGLNECLLSPLSPEERRQLDLLVSKLECHVVSWMSDVQLPKADRRHKHRASET